MIKKITNQNQISRHKLAEKINEIIDYINQNNHEYASIEEVVKARENHIADTSKKVADRMIGCVTLDIPESYKTDPYEKQRRWRGKLCKFWDNSDEPENCVYGVLVNIFDLHHEDCPFQCENGEWYEYCEPVKPDDDIIYKKD